MAAALSVLEVAALSELDEGKIRKEVEHGLFDEPRFAPADLVYFRLLALLGLQVGVDDRRRLYGLVKRAMKTEPWPRTIALSSVTGVKLPEFVTKNIADFEMLAREYELHPGLVLLEQGDATRDEQLDA